MSRTSAALWFGGTILAKNVGARQICDPPHSRMCTPCVDLIARPKGGLFRYHVKSIHFTIQGFGFLSAILWWGKIDGHVLLLRNCRHYLISRDLIWIKIVVGKTIYKQIVIILAIRFAVLSTYFNWNNCSIKFVNWLFSMIAKSSFETSAKQPRTTWHHNAAVTSQVALWRHECDA